MPEDLQISKSLVEQILDDFITLLKARKEFDVKSIEALAILSKKGDLKKANEVIEAIKVTKGSAE